MENVIPQDVENFILLHIDSIAQLEGLLLFHTDPQLQGVASDISRRLYITDDEALLLLRHLARHGFLEKQGSGADAVYRYAPSGTTTAQMVERLADIYARYLVPVTYLVHSKSKSKIQQFADAFWIRKE